ncbi:DNA mismatch repair endonuclease MutL [Massilibacterium senegalense]|uniref:DNA mismatch repair endonuclease MutL n=1 Tax=Massilibacterium senegalense TaxID=1632858 RepID=UPI0007848C80|nr:DNA mismatch repair endonuclease MutL [Massilibacterium senegalense]
MSQIVLLDDALANKIAAGEVVERPASVVKELVENALDASSTRIHVDIEEGGLAKIRIVDDGAGIREEDCERAFMRHATSKIKNEQDLFHIRTLGFRGEALPSIASVSKLTITTSDGVTSGVKLYLEGGKIVRTSSAPLRKGTEIVVTDLFYNTPARLKYLKTIHTEMGHITDVMNRMALAHPEVAFLLTHNGKKLFQTSGNGQMLQVIQQIYGSSVVKQMIPIHLESLDFTLDGFLAKPEINRASRHYISTLVNGRFIKNYPLAKAIIEGYRNLLPIGRYPIAVLSIKMDPILVDVNVHPAKLEVRFSKEKELNEWVTEGIREKFRQETLIPSVERPTSVKQKSEQQTFTFSSHQQPLIPTESEMIEIKETIAHVEEKGVVEKQDDVTITNKSVPIDEKWEDILEEMEEQERRETEEGENDSRVPTLYPIGQMHGTYILAENEQGLYIIDQHAAQERINFEYYRQKLANPSNDSQELLLPIRFEFTHAEVLKIEEAKDELQKVGIFLEPFGGRTYVVKSHPTWFPRGEEETLIREIIDQVIEQNKVDLQLLREDVAAMASCKASIKANQHLRKEEMFELLETLRNMIDPFTCPHGRPVMIHISTYDMQKLFKRVM